MTLLGDPLSDYKKQVFDDFVEIAVVANQNMSTDFRHQTICTIELTGTLLLADGSWYTQSHSGSENLKTS